MDQFAALVSSGVAASGGDDNYITAGTGHRLGVVPPPLTRGIHLHDIGLPTPQEIYNIAGLKKGTVCLGKKTSKCTAGPRQNNSLMFSEGSALYLLGVIVQGVFFSLDSVRGL